MLSRRADARPKVTLSPKAAETECGRPSMRECRLKHAVLGNCRANVLIDEGKY